MLTKCTMLFSLATNTDGGSQGNRVAGWSESWYSFETDFTRLKSDFRSFCWARAGLLSNGGAIVGQRFTQIDPKARAISLADRYPGNAGACDVPQMALFTVLPSQGQPNGKRLTLRGIPDGYVDEGEFRPPPTWAGRWLAFRSAANIWRFKAKNLTNPKVDIVSVDLVGNFTLADDFTYAKGQYVDVSRLKVSGGTLEGTFNVIENNGPRTGKLANYANTSLGVGGTIQLNEVTYPLVDGSAEPGLTVVVRKVGRPFGQYRGRSTRKAVFTP